jgi:hypothetical protein
MYLMALFATFLPNSNITPRKSKKDFIAIYIKNYKRIIYKLNTSNE